MASYPISFFNDFHSTDLSKAKNSYELQIIFEINIHVFVQSCTWKELTNFSKFCCLFPILWGKKIQHFNALNQLDIVHSFKADVCFLEVVKPGGFTSKSRINGCCFVTTYLKVNDVLLNAIFQRKTSSLNNAKSNFEVKCRNKWLLTNNAV